MTPENLILERLGGVGERPLDTLFPAKYPEACIGGTLLGLDSEHHSLGDIKIINNKKCCREIGRVISVGENALRPMNYVVQCRLNDLIAYRYNLYSPGLIF